MGLRVDFINPFGTAAHNDQIRETLRSDALDDTELVVADLKTCVSKARTGISGQHSTLTERMRAESLCLLKSPEQLSSRSDQI